MRVGIVFRGVIYSLIVVGLLATPMVRGQATTSPSTQPVTMRFKRFVITDEQGFKGMEVFHGVMPVDWTVKGGVNWKMGMNPPQHYRIHWGDAKNVCAFDVYPSLTFGWSTTIARGQTRVQPGQVVAGNIVEPPPTDQFDAFDKVIVQMFRPDLKEAKVVNKEKMPEVAKRIYDRINTDPNMAFAVAVGKETFEYELNGQTVEEVVSGIFEQSMYKQNNPTGIRHWSVTYATSQRAPKGELDQLKPIQAIMVQSMQMNPAWNQKVAALIQQRRQQALANQQQQSADQQAQFNAIENRISSESAANDAQHASYWQHSADLARQSDAEADVQREVSPWKDSNGDTYKLPNNYGQAWSGADGTIIMNNDPSYNPNSDPNLTPTNWTPMQQAGN